MKRFTFSCVLGLALVLGDVRAEMQFQRGQQLATPSPVAQARVVQSPATVQKSQPAQPVRQPAVTRAVVVSQPSVIFNKPSVAVQKPSAAVIKPSVIVNQPPVAANKPAVVPNNPSVGPIKPAVVVNQPWVMRTKPPVAPSQPVVAPNKTVEVPKKSTDVLNAQSGVSASANGMFAQPQKQYAGGGREFHKFRHSGNIHKSDCRPRGCRQNSVVVYVGGAPYWYPYYTAYPYYYSATPTAVYDNTNYAPPVQETASGAQAAPSYGEVGRQWGQDLRREIATWDEFVEYMRAYIMVATPAAQAEFREAFIASYGINGAAAYDKAAEQALQSSAQGPKVIDVSSAK